MADNRNWMTLLFLFPGYIGFATLQKRTFVVVNKAVSCVTWGRDIWSGMVLF